jgi:hypothetical protein
MKSTSFKSCSYHILAIVIGGIVVVQIGLAQIAKPGYDDKMLFRSVTGVTIGAVQQQWTIKDTGTFTQRSAPLSIAFPITNRMLFTLNNSGAITSSGSMKVQGFVDTRVSLSYVLPGDKFWFTGGMSFPTGKTSLTVSELTLSKFISQTAFAYKVPTFGQGYGGNLGMAYATSFTRRLVFGVGTSYFYRGTFEPISLGTGSTALEYNPGDEVSANAGIDYTTYSKSARFSVDITGTLFFVDQLSGRDIFKSGPRVMTFIVYSLRTDDIQHLVNARIRYRLKNTFYNAGMSTEYDAAVQYEGQYSATMQLNPWLMGTGIVEFKYHTADQVPFGTGIVRTGNSTIGSIGTDFAFMVSEIVSPALTLRYAAGTTTIDDIAYDVTGFEAGIGLKISF